MKLCEGDTKLYTSYFILEKIKLKYFDSTLPEVINRLQEVERERVEFVRKVLEKCLAGEREIVNIVNKCREDVEEARANLSVEKDHVTVVQR